MHGKTQAGIISILPVPNDSLMGSPLRGLPFRSGSEYDIPLLVRHHFVVTVPDHLEVSILAGCPFIIL